MTRRRVRWATLGLCTAALAAASACGGVVSTDAGHPACESGSCTEAGDADARVTSDVVAPTDAVVVGPDGAASDAPDPMDAVAPDAVAPVDAGITSCAGRADGTTLADGELCCDGSPIHPTSNRQCPARFWGSAMGVNNAPIVGGAASPGGRGYWLVSRNGGVYSYGDATFAGAVTSGGVSNVVGMAANPAGAGYWLVGSDGGVFAFGGAPFSGSLPGMHVTASNIVGMAANPSGPGYWLVGRDGGVFAFGGAPYSGSLPEMHVTVNNIVGIAANPAGAGYWLVGADGGVFGFGGAPFDGSLPGMHVTVNDVVAITANPDGAGYWLVGADGGVYTFGAGNYYASNALHDSSAPIVGLLASRHAYGYWMPASDGEVFVAPNAPPVSAATPAIGSGESYLGEHGLYEITVWDSRGQRNCNEGPFAQIPGDASHVIGRYSNDCTNASNWSLARWTVDWATHRVTFANMIFDTRPGAVPIAGGNRITTYYDATIASYAGELWVAGECGGSIAGAGTASACVGPLSSSSWTMNPARTDVAVVGNQSRGDGNLFSASVPKLLVFHGGLFVYWSAVEINASSGQWSNITERGTELSEFPASGGLLWASRLGGAVGAGDPTYTDEVWGLGPGTDANRVADIGGIFTDGTSVFANGSLAGSACGMPFWPPTCYALAFAKSDNPLGYHIFNDGTVLPAANLPTNMGGELRLFTDPSGADQLWGSYYTNVTGPRPLAFSGPPNAGHLLGYAIPPGTAFFDTL